MTNVTETLQALVAYYTGLGNWFALAYGNPGNDVTVNNEASGGSPAYARQSTSWTVTGVAAIGSGIIFNVPAGSYTFMSMCSGSAGSNQVDWAGISPQVIGAQATITIVPLATAS
jgi:hypothetical protein